MTDVDQFEFQTKYARYLSTQQRVSDWVKGPVPQNRPRIGRKPPGPRHIITKSPRAPTRSSDPSIKDGEFVVSTTVAHQQQTQLLESESSQIISPIVALISSALLICVTLPSLLTLSAFVVLLTYVGSLEDHVSLTVLSIIYTHFYILAIGVTKRKHR